VTTTSDVSDGTTTSIAALAAAPGADGRISLREAIAAANATSNAGGVNEIWFEIPTTDANYDPNTGVWSLTAMSLLPAITDAVTIDGSTQATLIGDANPGVFGTGGTVGVDGLVLSQVARPEIQIDDGAGLSQGLRVQASNVTITGLSIWGFESADIDLISGTGATIAGNLIGSRADAVGDPGVGIRSAGNGIAVSGATSGSISANLVAYIGGSGIAVISGTGFIVSSNEVLGSGQNDPAYDGINTAGSATTILGNLVHDNRGTGVAVWNNVGSPSGVQIVNNTITGNDFAPGAEGWAVNTLSSQAVTFDHNVIAGNTGVGLAVQAGTNNLITRNSITGNTGIGIDLGLTLDGVTANDALDADSGPDGLQNFPVLGAAVVSGDALTIAGSLSTAASKSYRIEFFSSVAADPSGYGEGQTYLGSAVVTTGGGGTAAFNVTLSGVSVSPGEYITATASVDLGGSVYGGTSEFSQAVTAVNHVLTVDTTADTADGDTTSIATLLASRGADGRISLREALLAANATANGTGGPDQILFDIPDALIGGAHTITPLSSLPTISDAVIVDASGEPDVAGNGNRPVVVIDGNNLAGDGLTLGATADGSTIRGLVIRDFGGNAIRIVSGSDGNTIAGNYLGRLTVGGLDAGAAEANGGSGVVVNGAGNTIGGSTAADRNVIAGNTGIGVQVYGASASGNVIAGNYIGLVASGTAMLGNLNDGVQLIDGASGNTVGGPTAAYRNVISGNSDGVQIGGATGANDNVVQNNFVGTDVTGMVDLGNLDDGLDIWQSSTNAQVLDNLVSGNSANGIFLGNTLGASSNAIVRGNLVGTAVDGTTPLGNGGDGINIGNGATADGSQIGGTQAGQGNIVAFNAGDGIAVLGSVNVSLLGNAVFSNTGLGVDLGPNGVTANDIGDADAGANGLQNYPQLTSAVSAGGNATIVGSLSSNASTTYRIEFFSSPVADGSGFGEGAVYLGYTTVITNGLGVATFNTTLPGVSVAVGHMVTATATVDLGGGSYGSSSEFSATRTVPGGAPGITVAPVSGLTTTEAGGIASFTVVLDSAPSADVTIAVSVSDASEASLSASSLTFTAANWSISSCASVASGSGSMAGGTFSPGIWAA
jgi:hypothetical protein